MKTVSRTLVTASLLLCSACGSANVQNTPTQTTTPDNPVTASTIVWDTYTNPTLGFSIDYPTTSGYVPAVNTDQCHDLIPVKVIETTNQIIFAQDYPLQEHGCQKGAPFSLQNPPLNDSVTGQFTINYAHAESTDAVEQFVKKFYGTGCTLDTKPFSRTPIDPNKPMQTYAVSTDNKMLEETTCPGVWGGNVSLFYNSQTKTVFTWKKVKRSFIDPVDTHSGVDEKMVTSFTEATKTEK